MTVFKNYSFLILSPDILAQEFYLPLPALHCAIGGQYLTISGIVLL